MVDIRIKDLPLEATPTASEFVAIDLSSTRRSTIQNIVEIGRPTASQAEAEAGTNPVKSMSPLTVKQSIASEVGVSIASAAQGLLASTALQSAAIGTTVQAFDADLTAIAALTSAADKVPYATGAGTWAFADFTSAGRAVAGAVDAAAQRAALSLGNSATLNVGTTAGTVAAGDDARIVSAIQPTTLPTTVFAIPLGGGNQSPVPVDLKNRFKHVASFEDFGIRLYSSGVIVKDNTAELQEAIDKVQALNGAIFAPPNWDGATTVETGPLVLRDGTVGGVNYDGAGVAFIGMGPGDRTSWQNGRFDLGQGLKLKAGSTGALITSPAKAGHLTMENMLLHGDGQNQRGIDFVSNAGPGYGFGGFFKQVYINAFLKEGMNIGGNRGRGQTEWLWIEYCGTAGSFAALAQGSADWEHVGIGLGVNNGAGLYMGSASQVRFFGGAMWMNEYGATISNECDDVDFFGVHFDQNQKHGTEITAYNGSATRRGTRRFVGCRWSDNSDSSSGTCSDIHLNTGVVDAYFAAPAFMGKADAAPKNVYCVLADSGAAFYADSFPFDNGAKKPYITAFINDWTRARFGGTDAANWQMSNSGAGLVASLAGGYGAEFRINEASLGGRRGEAPLRAEKIGGGHYNRALLQSTSNAFDFAQLVADSDAANASLRLSGKGTGRVGFGNKVGAADAVSDGYIEVVDNATGNIVKVMTRA